MLKKFIITGILLIITGIILGAFGAHGLKEELKDFPDKVKSFETGVRYQMYSAFSFLVVASLSHYFKNGLKSFFWILLLGTVFFSFSIYILCLEPIHHLNVRFLGPITPIGGLLMIIAWTILLFRNLKNEAK